MIIVVLKFGVKNDKIISNIGTPIPNESNKYTPAFVVLDGSTCSKLNLGVTNSEGLNDNDEKLKLEV
jgi:hypothetical protein